MTTMQIDRAVVEQALEALEKYRKMMFVEAGCRFGEGDAAITNLRAALAQQDEPLNLSDPAVQKRLATQWGYVPAAQAEPVEQVEPVAVVATQSDVWRGYNGQWAPPGEPIKMVQMLRDLPTGTLLYTAPPQRKPLTEEEMYSVEEEARKSFRQSQRGVRGQQITYWDGLTPWLIRAVERAHGIKE